MLCVATIHVDYHNVINPRRGRSEISMRLKVADDAITKCGKSPIAF